MILNYAMYFIVYSFLGWSCESIYRSIFEHKVINTGFLNGPFCPIYGFGAIFVIYFLSPFTDNPIALFLLGILVTSILEYITSYVMEKLFHTRWWDYSKHKFNINGRVCFLNSILFGILCMFVMYFIHPGVLDVIAYFSHTVQIIIVCVFYAYVVYDVFLSVRAAIDVNKQLEKLQIATTEFKDKFEIKKEEVLPKIEDFLNNNMISYELQEIKEGIEKYYAFLQEKQRKTSLRLKKAFPNRVSKKYDLQLSSISKMIKEYLDKEKEDK